MVIIETTRLDKSYPDSPLNSDNRPSWFEISLNHLNTALHGDTVEIIQHPKGAGRATAEISKIISRAKDSFVGILEKENGVLFLKPDDINNGSGCDVIISRAFSELALFVKLSRHLLAKTGLWLAMKGVLPEQELAAQQFQCLADEQDGVALVKIEVLKVAGLDAERHLVFLNLK